MARPRPAAGALAVGLAAVVVGALMQRTGTTTQVGVVPRPPVATVLPGSDVSGRSPSVTTAGERPVGAAAPPVVLRIPRLGLVAHVVPVGVGPAGALGVPDDPSVLGWWSSGAAPGDRSGSVVVDGHVDSARSGLGVLAHLRELKVGDTIQLSTASGRTVVFAVAGRRSYAKSALPASVFDQSLGERLVLITCGGQFDRRTAHYSDNVVLYAVPAGGPA
jgi:hypothetical protein